MSSSPKYARVTISPAVMAQLDELIGRRASGVDQILHQLLDSRSLCQERSSSLSEGGTSDLTRSGPRRLADTTSSAPPDRVPLHSAGTADLVGRGFPGRVSQEQILQSAERLEVLAKAHRLNDVADRAHNIASGMRHPGLPGSRGQLLSTEGARDELHREAGRIRRRIEEDERRQLILATVATAAGDLGYAATLTESHHGQTTLTLSGPTGSMRGSMRETDEGSDLVWEIDGTDTVETLVEGHVVRSCPTTERALLEIHERAGQLGVDVGALDWKGKAGDLDSKREHGARGSRGASPHGG